MLLTEIEKTIIEHKRNDEFIYPFYERYCFSNLPSTILKFFTIPTDRQTLPVELFREVETAGTTKIILFLVDGFGYHQWRRVLDHPSNAFKIFDRISQEGAVSPITTVFPSTTAAAYTTVNSGLTPQEHGLFEWLMYFQEIDMIINTLPFSPLGSTGQDTLLEKGVNPEILYNDPTIHQRLKNAGVKSFSFINNDIAESCYSQLVHSGSNIIPFKTYSDMAVNLRRTLERVEGPAYYYVYLNSLDSIEHQYGPHTDHYYAELSVLSFVLQTEFLNKVESQTAKETLILLTSDHGQLPVSPADTLYLNQYQPLIHSFQRSKAGHPILPTGSPRDVFLHINPTELETTQAYLKKTLRDKAKIMTTPDAIKLNLFGTGKPTSEFYVRAGNLLILPYSNRTIWYAHEHGKPFDALGFHGGLHKEEILVPFSIARLSQLIDGSA